MKNVFLRNGLKIILYFALGSAIVLTGEVIAALVGPSENFTNPDRSAVDLGGSGKPLNFVLLGDSTAAGEGTDRSSGIGIKCAQYLAINRPVRFVNLGISGARLIDVVQKELPEVVALNPDIVLIAAGANDGTHFTSGQEIETQTSELVSFLKRNRPNIQIIFTGSPDLGGAHRFYQPLRWFAGTQSDRVNRHIELALKNTNVIFAPLSHNTGAIFRRDPSLLSIDKFHPNKHGYQIWLPTLFRALDEAQANLARLRPHKQIS